jgi:hypothetical protein
MALDLHASARVALDQAVSLGLSMGQAWLMLAHWVTQHFRHPADSALTVALRSHVDGIDVQLLTQCMKLFDRTLGGFASDSWRRSRMARLRQALTRSQP